MRTFIQQLRQASSLTSGDGGHNSKRLDGDPTKRPPTLRALTWFIVKRPENRDEGDEQLLKQISEGQAKLATLLNWLESLRLSSGGKRQKSWMRGYEKPVNASIVSGIVLLLA